MYEAMCRHLRSLAKLWGVSTPREAADAIEELSKQVEKWEEISDIWRAAYAGLERRMYPKPPKEET